jgi:hypothetical protein
MHRNGGSQTWPDVKIEAMTDLVGSNLMVEEGSVNLELQEKS